MRSLCVCAFFTLLALGVPFTTGACGGGGGGTPPPGTPANPFSGTYFYQAYAGDPGPPSAWAWWGTAVANGAGMVTGGTFSWNTAGGVFSGPVTPFPYTVDAANRVVWSPGTVFELKGGIAADGRVSVLGSTAPLSFPGIAITLQKAGTFDQMSLNGDYHLAVISRAGANHQSYWGLVNFNGVNTVTYGLFKNDNGSIALASLPANTYSVQGDGTMNMGFGGQNFRGGILQGGELAVLSGTTSPSSPTQLMVLIRASTAASGATFDGTYHHTWMRGQLNGPPHWSSWTGTAAADGAGTLTIHGGTVMNEDGALTLIPGDVDINGGYTVTLTGEMTTNFTQGAVSPSGDFAMLGGLSQQNNPPALWFFVR